MRGLPFLSSVIRDASDECQVLEGQKIKLEQRTQQLVLWAHVVCAHVGLITCWLSQACADGPSFPSFLLYNHMAPSPVPYLNVTSVNRNEWGKEFLGVWDVNLQDLLKP